MKKCLLALALLMGMLQATAQTEKTKEQLRKELIEHPQQDKVRVDLLYESSFQKEFSIKERKQMTLEALSISQKIGYKRGEGLALSNLAYFEKVLKNTKTGDSIFHVAEAFANESSNPELIGFNYYRSALALSWAGDDTKALRYLLDAEKTFEKSGSPVLLSACQNSISELYQSTFSNYPLGMEYALKALHSAEMAGSSSLIFRNCVNIGSLYSLLGDYDNALVWLKKAELIDNKKNRDDYTNILNVFGEVYRLSGKYSEAITVYKQALAMYRNGNISSSLSIPIAINESNLADTYLRMDSLSLAFQYAFKCLPEFKIHEDPLFLGWVYRILGRAYLKKNMPDSSLHYANIGLDFSNQAGTIEYMRDNVETLSKAYAHKKDFANAYKYHLQFVNYTDSMLGTEVKNKTFLLKHNSDLDKKEAQIAQLNQQKQAQQNFLISVSAILVLIIIVAIAMMRNIRLKKKANRLLQEQKREIELQRDQTNAALDNLKQTQAQLVHSEKMASLGELTAGIAHEIQNPLNFVNNFSEINDELIKELKAEAEKGNLEEVKAIANDIAFNSEKINHHGKRADAIVKGMLQHSRASTGQKEPTDINALCDEYLRLAYHGLRAKDKSFNATTKTEFDNSFGKINVVSQDIGRVVLNLINNAFYAVNEKAKLNIAGYEPTVIVSTKKDKDKIKIEVKDNGNGIPQKILDKIFQPFFTTKPTGQGTGLGLSLAYDIVTKGHGGELKVETKEGEGSSFIIQLPVN